MKALRQSTLAAVIALISTAALGPGTFFPQQPDAAGQRALLAAMPNTSTLGQLEASMRATLPGLTLTMQDAPTAEAALENADFLSVDFVQGHGNENGRALATGGTGFPVSQGADASARTGYWPTGAAPAAGPAPLQGQQLAPGSGFKAAGIGPLSGLNADPALAGPSVISLDDPATAARDIPQAPLLALAPPADDLGIRNPSTDGAAGPASAIPEPASGMLLGLGLLGLLAAGRKRHPSANAALTA
jgi:hypothetical protein